MSDFELMIQKTDSPLFFALDKNSMRELVLREGETVNAKLLSREQDGNVRISLRGFTFLAKAPENLKAGQVFKMLVSFRENQLVLTPLLPSLANGDETSAKQLNKFQDVQLAEAIAKSFLELNAPLEPTKLTRLYTLLEHTLKSFRTKKELSNKEKKLLKNRLSFLATNFLEKNLSLKPSELKKIYTRIFELENSDEELEGKNENTKNTKEHKEQTQEKLVNSLSSNNKKEKDLNSKDKSKNLADDLILVANHIKGRGNFHWVLVPFEKEGVSLNNNRQIKIKGLVSFLINVKSQTCEKIVLRASKAGYNFLFELKNKTCTLYFEDENDLPKIKKEKFLKQLKTAMQSLGLTIPCQMGTPQEITPLDIEV
ncbi:MAG: hypothetical protein P1P64_05195 [Treponemataceae bacterium]